MKNEANFKCKELQFLIWPLVARSKCVSVPFYLHLEMHNFTSEINKFRVMHIVPSSTISTKYGHCFFQKQDGKDFKASKLHSTYQRITSQVLCHNVRARANNQGEHKAYSRGHIITCKWQTSQHGSEFFLYLHKTEM